MNLPVRAIENIHSILRDCDHFIEIHDNLSMKCIDSLLSYRSLDMVRKATHVLLRAKVDYKHLLLNKAITPTEFCRLVAEQSEFENISGISQTEYIKQGAKRLKDDSDPNVNINTIINSIISATEDYTESLEMYKQMAQNCTSSSESINSAVFDTIIDSLVKSVTSVREAII